MTTTVGSSGSCGYRPGVPGRRRSGGRRRGTASLPGGGPGAVGRAVAAAPGDPPVRGERQPGRRRRRGRSTTWRSAPPRPTGTCPMRSGRTSWPSSCTRSGWRRGVMRRRCGGSRSGTPTTTFMSSRHWPGQDGKRVWPRDDFYRAREASLAVEARYRLTPTAPADRTGDRQTGRAEQQLRAAVGGEPAARAMAAAASVTGHSPDLGCAGRRATGPAGPNGRR